MINGAAREERPVYGLLRAGLIGHPVHLSWSPVMHSAAFAASGMSAGYELWDTEPGQLAGRIATLRRPEILGANITIPYKTEVLPLLDAVTGEVDHSLGAVNTIVSEKTAAGVRLVGYNTDVLALQRILREERAWSRGNHLLVVGAGGAARAILAVALREGLEPWIAVRRPEAGQRLLAAFVERQLPTRGGVKRRTDWQSQFMEHVVNLADAASMAAVLHHTHVLVQSTPIGTGNSADSPFPLPLIKQLPPAAFVFDMVYNPPVTALVSEALAHGLRAYGGLAMLLHQGAEAFSLWTGLQAPLDQMRVALEQQTQATEQRERHLDADTQVVERDREIR